MGFLRRLFQRSEKTAIPEKSRSPESLPGLVRMIDQTRETEYDCEDVYSLMDRYAEMVARGEDASQIMPLVRQHLEMCPDCREEVEQLIQVLRSAG